MTEKKPYVEIKVDRKGFADTVVKIDGREVYVSELKFDLNGPGLPRVQLTICDQASLSVACEADVTVVDATPYQKDCEPDLVASLRETLKIHKALIKEAYEELRLVRDSSERWEVHTPDEPLMDKLHTKT